jgi:hypothetical protein
MLKPLFIFSLPRSGSTLLQRVLASHSQISSRAEPWVMLPFIYPLKKYGVYAEYSHQLMHQALIEFIASLPNGKQDYLESISLAMLTLYQKAAAEDAEFFLDKTPRYALISNEIIEMFPDGKFIFLWRNPLSIVASIIETFGGGRWNIYLFKIDLFDGMSNLIDSYEKHANQVHAVRYEDFLNHPDEELSSLAEYLKIELNDDLLQCFSKVDLNGSMGDQIGVKDYQAVTKSPIDKWKTVINNPLRKIWCRRYLHWLGKKRLATMGYSLESLLDEVDACNNSFCSFTSDMFSFFYGIIYCLADVASIKEKIRTIGKQKRIKVFN